MISGSVTGMWDPAGRQLTHSAQVSRASELWGTGYMAELCSCRWRAAMMAPVYPVLCLQQL
jgi:hypothetical protein